MIHGSTGRRRKYAVEQEVYVPELYHRRLLRRPALLPGRRLVVPASHHPGVNTSPSKGGPASQCGGTGCTKATEAPAADAATQLSKPCLPLRSSCAWLGPALGAATGGQANDLLEHLRHQCASRMVGRP